MRRKIIRAVGTGFGLLVLVGAGGLVFVTTALPEVGPLPDLKVEGTDAQVEPGQHLAHPVAVCMDCHSLGLPSNFPGPLVSGSLGGGGEEFSRKEGFPGTFYTPNITPYAPKEWTDGKLYRAIAAGVFKSGEPLYLPEEFTRHQEPGSTV